MSSSVDLFRIVSDGVLYRMTSAEQEQVHNAETYEPAGIDRSDVQNKAELSKQNLDVSLALDHPLALALLSRWSETITTLTVFDHRPSGTDTIWKGRLVSIVPEDANVRMVFESIFTSLRRTGVRARMQKSCRHPLYGRGCWVDPEAFAEASTISSITGRTVVAPGAAAFPDAYFTGGMLKAPDGTLSYISDHEGDVLTLNRISAALAEAFVANGPATAVTIYPGCPHDYVSCRDKFANDDNYGGFDYIPTKNPMGGSSIV